MSVVVCILCFIWFLCGHKYILFTTLEGDVINRVTHSQHQLSLVFYEYLFMVTMKYSCGSAVL